MQLLAQETQTPKPIPNAEAPDESRKPVSKKPAGNARAKRAVLFRCLAVLLVVVLATVLLLPAIIANTSLHSRVLSYSLEDGAVATADSFEIGWFSPLAATGVQIQKKGDDKPVKVEKLEVSKSLLDIVRGKLKDAVITLTKPELRLVLDDGGKSAAALFPKMKTRVINGQLTVERKDVEQPVLQIDGLNFVSNVKSIKGGRQMSITDTTILDHYKLTPEMTQKGLGLVAPLLARAGDVKGAVSLKVDSLKVDRVDNQSQLRELRGKLILHDVTSTAGPVVSDVVDVLSHMRERPLSKRVTVTRESVVTYELKDKRLHHDGFAFVLPEIARDLEVRSRGSVGFDETLDVTLSMIVPESLAVGYPVLKPLQGQPLELKVRGTLSKPVVGLPNDQRVADYIASKLVPTSDGEPEALPAAVVRLIGGVADRNKLPNERTATLPGSVLNLIRSARELRQQRIQNGGRPAGRRRRSRFRRPE